MISCSTVQKRSIRFHYDLSTLFYRLLWGPHIHHGLWAANESPRRAAVRLTEEMIRLIGIHGGERVLDIGCGMGGSSIHLAKHHQADVTGVTLSPVQRRWAATSALFSGVRNRTRFQCADAEAVEFPPGAFDVVWSIECTEHLFDKPAFFRRAALWVKPGGTMAICAWLAGDGDLPPEKVQQVHDVCEGFLCPSLGSSADYETWMRDAGLNVVSVHDWTAQVLRTWEICRDRVAASRVRWLARLIDRDTVLFLDRFDTILKAYQTGAMKYGCFIASK